MKYNDCIATDYKLFVDMPAKIVTSLAVNRTSVFSIYIYIATVNL